MLKKITILCSCLALLCLLLSATAAQAKEKPVEGVWLMFDNFNKLEEEFRNDKWGEAAELLKTIDGDYKKLVASLKTTVDANTLQKFSFLLISLQKRVEAKNAEEMEKPYATLQGLFLDIMGFYDYPNPPVLLITARYVDESKEALEKGDVKEVGEEMAEIQSFKPRIIAALKEKGVADPEGVMAKVEATGKAAKAGKKEEVSKLLAELAALFAPYKVN